MDKPKIDLKSKVHPFLASLPAHLKDPKNFYKIQKFVLKSLAGKCNHGEVADWAKCKDCQKRFQDRRNVLKGLGFKHPAQYQLWKKVHEQIREKFPLVDWEKLNAERALENLK